MRGGRAVNAGFRAAKLKHWHTRPVAARFSPMSFGLSLPGLIRQSMMRCSSGIQTRREIAPISDVPTPSPDCNSWDKKCIGASRILRIVANSKLYDALVQALPGAIFNLESRICARQHVESRAFGRPIATGIRGAAHEKGMAKKRCACGVYCRIGAGSGSQRRAGLQSCRARL